jgi:hypothetical protein
MVLDAFKRSFATPAPGTGVPLGQLGLDGFAFLVELARELGCGMFQQGMLSVASRRERDAAPDQWRALVPQGARHFATTGLGDLFFVTPPASIVWIETQYGRVEAVPMAAERFFDWLAGPEQQRKYLAAELWEQRCAELAPDEVLAFVPALALGGAVDWGNLEKVKLREHLSLLAQLVL